MVMAICRRCEKYRERATKGGNICRKCANLERRKPVDRNPHRVVNPHRCPTCGYKIITKECVLCRVERTSSNA